MISFVQVFLFIVAFSFSKLQVLTAFESLNEYKYISAEELKNRINNKANMIFINQLSQTLKKVQFIILKFQRWITIDGMKNIEVLVMNKHGNINLLHIDWQEFYY